MKNMVLIALVSGLFINLASADSRCCRVLSKKDRQELAELMSGPLNEMHDGNSRLQDLVGQLNEVATTIQNFIVDLHNDPQSAQILVQLELLKMIIQELVIASNHSNDSSAVILDQVVQMKILLQQIVQNTNHQDQVLGNLNDASVGEQQFHSVSDIDESPMSVTTLLKSIFREQIAAKFVS